MNRRVRFWLLLGFGIATALAVAGWILRALFEVLHGRGAETYISARGLQVHWVDVLTMWIAVFAAILVMLVAMVIVAWHKKRDLDQLKKMESRDGT
jgi:type II secretory pathway component PulL